jgi:purine-binding chemotaxis protein CheW
MGRDQVTRDATSSDGPLEDDKRFIAFQLAGVTHALSADDVREVLGMVLITPLPDAPPWLSGVINLRGRVIPVIDLRVRIGVHAAQIGLSTPILVADYNGRPIGLIADAIDQIIQVPASSIQAPDDLMRQSSLVEAVVQHGPRLMVVVDLNAVCAGAEQFTEPTA